MHIQLLHHSFDDGFHRNGFTAFELDETCDRGNGGVVGNTFLENFVASFGGVEIGRNKAVERFVNHKSGKYIEMNLFINVINHGEIFFIPFG